MERCLLQGVFTAKQPWLASAAPGRQLGAIDLQQEWWIPMHLHLHVICMSCHLHVMAFACTVHYSQVLQGKAMPSA